MKNLIGLFLCFAFALTLSVGNSYAHAPKTEKVCFADKHKTEVSAFTVNSVDVTVQSIVYVFTPANFDVKSTFKGSKSTSFSSANVYSNHYTAESSILRLKRVKVKSIKQWDIVSNPVKTDKIDKYHTMLC